MRTTLALLIVLLILAACGDGDEGTLDPNDPVDPTATVPAPRPGERTAAGE
jgi:hypothetical protein